MGNLRQWVLLEARPGAVSLAVGTKGLHYYRTEYTKVAPILTEIQFRVTPPTVVGHGQFLSLPERGTGTAQPFASSVLCPPSHCLYGCLSLPSPLNLYTIRFSGHLRSTSEFTFPSPQVAS